MQLPDGSFAALRFVDTPGFLWSAPWFPDIDRDGIPDMLDANHFYRRKCPLVFPVWDVGHSVMPPSTPVESGASWDVALRRGLSYTPATEASVPLFQEPQGFHDLHSLIHADLDGDGIPDVFGHTGGGEGTGQSSRYDSVLFWGVASPTSPLGYQLAGKGATTASDAGLECRNCRGSHAYW